MEEDIINLTEEEITEDKIIRALEYYHDPYVIAYTNEKKLLEETKVFNRYAFAYRNKNTDDLKPIQYPLYDNYIIVHSPHKALSEQIYRYAKLGIRIYRAKKDQDSLYYVLPLPQKKEERTEFINIMKSGGYAVTSTLTLYVHDRVETFFTPNRFKKDLGTHWKERLKLLRKFIDKNPPFYYKPEEIPLTYFLNLQNDNGNRTAEDFIKCNSSNFRNLHDFYIHNVLIRHLIFNTNIYNQTEYTCNRISILSKHLTPLLPPNLTRKELLTLTSPHICRIEKVKSIYTFSFNPAYLQHIKEDIMNKTQFIKVPLTLFLQCFDNRNLSKNGLKFVLAMLFAYCNRYNSANYKISTLIDLCDINTNRGYRYILEQLNSKFKYLKQIHFITDMIDISPENIKNDDCLKIKIAPYLDWYI